MEQTQKRTEDNKIKDIIGRKQRAAVLIPLLREEGEWKILFEVRSPGIRQGGEICFPGGRVEEGEDPGHAAVRETVEELLIVPEQLSGMQERIRMPGPGGQEIIVHSGILENYRGTYAEAEVSRVFTVPIKELAGQQPETYSAYYEIHLPDNFPYDRIPKGRNYPWARIPRELYFYSYQEEVIWGLTADILHSFLSQCAGAVDLCTCDHSCAEGTAGRRR